MPHSKRRVAALFLIAGITACTARYGAVPTPENQRFQEVELHARMTTVAWGEIWNRELELDDGAQRALEDVIDTAARTLVKSGASPVRLHHAEGALRRFVAAIEADVSRTRSANVSAGLIDGVKRRICPLFPLC